MDLSSQSQSSSQGGVALERREATPGAASALPCLFKTSQSGTGKKGTGFDLSASAKKAETLYVNLSGLIKRVGIERVGFVTYTFSDHVTDRYEASRRFNSLSANILRPDGLELITIPERQGSGRFHFHSAASFPYDIRTGFDFESCRLANEAKRRGDDADFRRYQGIYFKSANSRLRGWWSYLRSVAPRYGFGRCETLPILSNAQALARYVGAYVTTATGARLDCDKGMRTVRYALDHRTASLQWAWVEGNGAVWRRGLQLIGQILEIDYETFKDRFGKHGMWRHRKFITCLGQNFAAALPFVAAIPEWADYESRVAFLVRLCSHFDQDEDFSPSECFGLSVETENCPF